MMRLRSYDRWILGLSAVAPFALAVACSSNSVPTAPLAGDDDDDAATTNPPPVGTMNGEGGVGDGSAEASAPADDSGSPNDGSMTTPDGAATPDGSAGDAGPPLCNPATVWGAGVLIPSSTTADDRLGAVTPDELTIAWTTPVNGDAAAGGTVMWADRASVTSAFGTTQTLAMPGVAYSAVAIGNTGLLMIVVRADHTGFVELTRGTRGDVFANASEANFGEINPDRMAGDVDTVADPVLSAAGTELYFTEVAAGASDTFQSAGRSDVTSRWLGQFEPPSTDLVASNGKLRRPTGIAADGRTLFIWDEVAAKTRAGYRATTSDAFASFVDVGVQMYAQPNASCRRIYYSAPNGASLDLYYADAQ